MTLQLDRSCNLCCKTCRSKPYVMGKEESDKLYDTLVSKLRPLLRNCRTFHVLPRENFFGKRGTDSIHENAYEGGFPALVLWIYYECPVVFRKAVEGVQWF